MKDSADVISSDLPWGGGISNLLRYPLLLHYIGLSYNEEDQVIVLSYNALDSNFEKLNT